MSEQADAILELIADLRIVYNNATSEINKLRNMLNVQNESMLELQREIDKLNSENNLLRQEIEFKKLVVEKSNG